MTSLNTPVHTASVGRPALSQTFPCQPSAAETGRKLVQNVLDAWRLDELADRAALIVTELIANATKHTPCHDIRLTVGRPSASRVRVSVVDWEPERLPVAGLADHGDESGRGLLLIDAVSDCWGYDLHGSDRCPWGKEVWAELRLKSGQ
ncbi:ATP-binding protein [Streptomyces sp. NPDC051018]|uniref:ATP-binding protein n=1 Tax=Streptomyces sp. NPDC051018 TaxID=3365639 RepID=UPI00379D7F04